MSRAVGFYRVVGGVAVILLGLTTVPVLTNTANASPTGFAVSDPTFLQQNAE